MENELNYIQDERLRKTFKYILEQLPDYFWEIPASSSGKYHPQYALGEGGLVRHTKSAVRIAYDLLHLEMFDVKFKDWMKDMIVGALLIHDGLKYGYDYNTKNYFEHPLYIANFIDELKKLDLTHDEKEILKGLVSSHMGEWNTCSWSNVELPKPITDAEMFVHMCDYLASRKYLEVPFDEEGNIE